MGKLGKGTYAGWVRERVVAEFPSWLDENGNVQTDPVWQPKFDMKWRQSFKIK